MYNKSFRHLVCSHALDCLPEGSDPTTHISPEDQPDNRICDLRVAYPSAISARFSFASRNL
eukprot:scaffold3791_cov390-Prasinococcus_capsulatus_cf.AAC.28